MKKTIRDRLISLISIYEHDIKDLKEIRKMNIKNQDWYNVAICQQSIYDKEVFIKQLKEIL